jgi:hypothetical protein
MDGDGNGLNLGNQGEHLGDEEVEDVEKKKDDDISSSDSEEETAAQEKTLKKNVGADLSLHKDNVVGTEEITELTVPGLNLKLQRCASTPDCDLFAEPHFDFVFFQSNCVHVYYGSYFINQAIGVVIGDCFDLISESDNEIKIASLFLFASHCTDTGKLSFYFINQDYWRNREDSNQFKFESVTMVTQNKEWTLGNKFITSYIIEIISL